MFILLNLSRLCILIIREISDVFKIINIKAKEIKTIIINIQLNIHVFT